MREGRGVVTKPLGPSFMKEPYGFMDKARRIVFEHVKRHLAENDYDTMLDEKDVTAYWFSKEDQDWRVFLTTTLPDNVYYKVRHDSRAGETYLDIYHKFESRTFPDEEAY